MSDWRPGSLEQLTAGLGSTSYSRRSLLRLGGASIVGLGAAQLLSACAGSESSTSPGKTGGAVKRGGTLTVASVGAGASETLVPGKSVNFADYARIFQLYDPLFRRGTDASIEPWLVESAEPSADAMAWTLKLRKGMTWHDGKPVTADDLVWTVNSWQSKDFLDPSGLQVFLAKDSIKKVDELTATIQLSQGVAEFPSLTTMANYVLIPNGWTPNAKPVGTGPFVYESFQPGHRSVFKRNPKYWKSEFPYADTLVIDTSFRDDQARLNALLSGTVNIAPQLPLTLAKAQQSSGQITLLNAAGPLFQCFTMRCDLAPFNDARVRQAVRLIANRKQMVESVLVGFGRVGNDLAPSGVKYFDDSAKREQDLDQAKSLLASAGANGLQLELSTSEVLSGFVASATLLQADAKKVGVDIKLKQIDPSIYFTDAGGWPSYPFGQSYYNSPTGSLTQFFMASLHTGAAYNETRWATKESDKRLFEAIATTDETQAQDRWQAIQQTQFDEGGYLIWDSMNFVDGLGANVGGLEPSRGGPLGGYSLMSAGLKG